MVASARSATAALPASPCTSPTSTERAACAAAHLAKRGEESRRGMGVRMVVDHVPRARGRDCGRRAGCHASAGPPGARPIPPRPREGRWRCASRPRATSIAATASSRERPSAGGTVTRKRTMIAPTTAMVTVWPAPQRAPMQAPASKRRVAAHDGRHRHDVIRVGGVLDAEQEPERGRRRGRSPLTREAAAPSARRPRPHDGFFSQSSRLVGRIRGRLGRGPGKDLRRARGGDHDDALLVRHHHVARGSPPPRHSGWAR